MAELLIGWASADITPPRPAMMKGQWRVRVSQRVGDPVTATALAIEGDKQDQALMVSCDLAVISEEECRAAEWI